MSTVDAQSPLGIPWIRLPFKLTISFTARCNLVCRHCYADCGARTNSELTTDEWLRFVDELIDDGFVSLFFEGGEPFARDDFEGIVARATAKMFVSIRTNGTLIDGPRAARLAQLHVGRVYVDLLGAVASTHDRMTGAPGSFAAATDGVRFLREAGIRTSLLTILTREISRTRLGATRSASCVSIRLGAPNGIGPHCPSPLMKCRRLSGRRKRRPASSSCNPGTQMTATAAGRTLQSILLDGQSVALIYANTSITAIFANNPSAKPGIILYITRFGRVRSPTRAPIAVARSSAAEAVVRRLTRSTAAGTRRIHSARI
jgi:uncharacterized Fe-S cluster-containing radical SAM superfamily protein